MDTQPSQTPSIHVVSTPILFPVGPRIAAGVARIDEMVDFDWRGKIDRATLNLAYAKHCITGQLFGDYRKGCSVLGIKPDFWEAAKFGLHVQRCCITTKHREFEALTHGWLLALDLNFDSIRNIQIFA